MSDTVSKAGFPAASKFNVGDKVRIYIEGSYFARGVVKMLRPYRQEGTCSVKMSNGKQVIVREQDCEAWND